MAKLYSYTLEHFFRDFTEEEIMDYYAVGQCTPGIIAVNTATFIGYYKKGIIGGIFATLGVIFPSIVIILLIASLILFVSVNVSTCKTSSLYPALTFSIVAAI